MELMRLRYFVAVAETGHMQQAADQLHVAQSTLSTSIKRLEEELGVKLFQRVGRRLELNNIGRMFLKDAKALLRQAEQLEQKMESLRLQQAHTLTILSLVPEYSAYILPLFQQQVPESHCSLLRPENEAAACAALEHGTADVALTLCPLCAPEVQSSLIFTDETLLLCSVDSVFADQAVVSLADLAGLPFLTLTAEGGFDRFCVAAFSAAGVPFPEWQRLQAPESIPFAVQHGQGISLTSRSAFRNLAPRFPDLCALPLKEDLPWCVWLTLSTPPTPRAEQFTQFLRSIAASNSTTVDRDGT